MYVCSISLDHCVAGAETNKGNPCLPDSHLGASIPAVRMIMKQAKLSEGKKERKSRGPEVRLSLHHTIIVNKPLFLSVCFSGQREKKEEGRKALIKPCKSVQPRVVVKIRLKSPSSSSSSGKRGDGGRESAAGNDGAKKKLRTSNMDEDIHSQFPFSSWDVEEGRGSGEAEGESECSSSSNDVVMQRQEEAAEQHVFFVRKKRGREDEEKAIDPIKVAARAKAASSTVLAARREREENSQPSRGRRNRREWGKSSRRDEEKEGCNNGELEVARRLQKDREDENGESVSGKIITVYTKDAQKAPIKDSSFSKSVRRVTSAKYGNLASTGTSIAAKSRLTKPETDNPSGVKRKRGRPTIYSKQQEEMAKRRSREGLKRSSRSGQEDESEEGESDRANECRANDSFSSVKIPPSFCDVSLDNVVFTRRASVTKTSTASERKSSSRRKSSSSEPMDEGFYSATSNNGKKSVCDALFGGADVDLFEHINLYDRNGLEENHQESTSTSPSSSSSRIGEGALPSMPLLDQINAQDMTDLDSLIASTTTSVTAEQTGKISSTSSPSTYEGEDRRGSSSSLGFGCISPQENEKEAALFPSSEKDKVITATSSSSGSSFSSLASPGQRQIVNLASTWDHRAEQIDAAVQIDNDDNEFREDQNKSHVDSASSRKKRPQRAAKPKKTRKKAMTTFVGDSDGDAEITFNGDGQKDLLSTAEERKWYSCKICERVSGNLSYHTQYPERLQRHEAYHVSHYEKGFRCPDCNIKLTSLNKVRHHEKIMHGGGKEFECRVCGAEVTELQVHLRVHRDERPFRCEICGVDFRHKNSMVRHMFQHSSKKPHKCNYCTKVFIAADRLSSHVRKKHPEAMRATNTALISSTTKTTSTGNAPTPAYSLTIAPNMSNAATTFAYQPTNTATATDVNGSTFFIQNWDGQPIYANATPQFISFGSSLNQADSTPHPTFIIQQPQQPQFHQSIDIRPANSVTTSATPSSVIEFVDLEGAAEAEDAKSTSTKSPPPKEDLFDIAMRQITGEDSSNVIAFSSPSEGEIQSLRKEDEKTKKKEKEEEKKKADSPVQESKIEDQVGPALKSIPVQDDQKKFHRCKKCSYSSKYPRFLTVHELHCPG